MKESSNRNRTMICTPKEIDNYSKELLELHSFENIADICDRIICQDMFFAVKYLPNNEIDLLILDPPYNLSKNYNNHIFRKKNSSDYKAWFENMINNLIPLLKSNASIYICSDWKTSIIIAPLLEKYFYIQNRITWEREKGRGANKNWKNNTEDIWFCTLSKDYIFNIESVKMRKKVIAPYRQEDGSPKDWQESEEGKIRLTCPSNIWTDITIPFWSMPENTCHPVQKPEKLIAKLILASSNPGHIILDPFLGSGTTAVVAKKLKRHFIGIELNREYCCLAMKRLIKAHADNSIQGYSDGIFWDRNARPEKYIKAKK